MREGVAVAQIHERVRALQRMLLETLAGTPSAALSQEQLVPPRFFRARGNFLTFRFPGAAEMQRELLSKNVIVDVRGDRLRIGFGIYHDREDVDELVRRLV